MKTIKILKKLLNQNKINKQEFRTYRGQILSGDIEGCLRGLKRKNLFEEV